MESEPQVSVPQKVCGCFPLGWRVNARWQRVLTWALLVTLLAVLLVNSWGKWEARQLEVSYSSLPADALHGVGPLRVAVCGDVHSDRTRMARAVDEILAAKPDLIVFVGDLVHAEGRFKRSRWAVEEFSRLVAVAPTFAVLGNHDMEKQEQVQRVLKRAGVQLLHNERRTWRNPRTGRDLVIVGLGDWNEADDIPEACLLPVGQELSPVLLLAHDPEARTRGLEGFDWDVMLAGHTHGGQLGNPFTGTKYSFRSDMAAGWYNWEDARRILVTRGVGSIWGRRYFCRPEVNIIDMR